MTARSKKEDSPQVFVSSLRCCFLVDKILLSAVSSTLDIKPIETGVDTLILEDVEQSARGFCLMGQPITLFSPDNYRYDIHRLIDVCLLGIKI